MYASSCHAIPVLSGSLFLPNYYITKCGSSIPENISPELYLFDMQLMILQHGKAAETYCGHKESP
jgi:hypothetical protein